MSSREHNVLKKVDIEIKPVTYKQLRVALAGQPNVGKSVIFNHITGLSQIVGNWPGKTVEKAEGKARFENYEFNIIDLPGIYSLSTYSLEEIVSREYILNDKPDYIINVVDANQLERNLFFTQQLVMLQRPLILVLNQYDLLQQRGYEFDIKKLEELLGIPVIPTVAVHNRGIHEILEKIIELEKEPKKEIQNTSNTLLSKECNVFGSEIEIQLGKVIKKLIEYNITGISPERFLAIKLLENDEVFKEQMAKQVNAEQFEDIMSTITQIRENLEILHGHSISEVMNAEFYQIASKIVNNTIIIKKPSRKLKWHNFVDHITLHSSIGYMVLALILFGSYFSVFWFGNLVSSGIDAIYESMTPGAIEVLGGEASWAYRLVWLGMAGGLFAGLGGVLPYVIPFFAVIEILQDTGYLPRAAYLMDKMMHTMGMHGKTIIPILLGFGCNVPAVTAAMIMETEREKKKAILISSMIPCSAVTTIVLGIVAKFLGIWYAVMLYMINFFVIFITGKLMSKFDKEEETELIIELHDFRKPNFRVISKQTWFRSKEFVTTALPLIVLFGVILQVIIEFNIMAPINWVLTPITVWLLGLPAGIGVYLFYGVVRKELNLVLLEIYVISLGMTMTEFFTPIQMITFTLVTMLYVPCIATIIVIRKQAGTKFATQVFFYEVGIAIVIATIVRLLYALGVLIFG